jgi:predicted phage baseplate assembly protein
MVAAGQVSLLMTRPLGVRAVTNPTAPTGADDPETLDDARGNAPLTVLTLDRIVSVRDFEDFAAAFAGVGKAQAAVLWNGERRLVHLTVAGAGGAAVPEGSALLDHLRAAVDAARHVDQPVVVASYEPLAFGLAAGVVVDPAHRDEDVLAAVAAALLAAFSFEARGFGQGVTTAEVLAVMQAVPGVVAVDLDALGGHDPFASPRLLARAARWEGGALRPAELLTVDPAGLTLTAKAP